MIVVTHLLGTGHLARALILARAYQDAGETVVVASGGRTVAHLDRGDVPIVQLSPLQSDGVNFSRLLDANGSLAGADVFARRQDALLDTYQTFQPDVLITELYPFGRRSLRGEFGALLHAATLGNGRPLICASIRDILAAPSKPVKVQQTEDIITQFYDAVLVHGDETLTPLEDSWPVTPALATKLQYTGYIAPPAVPAHPDGIGRGEIIVSAGGGPVGAKVFSVAAETARRCPDTRWRFLGHELPTVPANVIAEPPRPDFRSLMPHAAASVSLCGYNTALDVLQSAAPAVFIPFDDGHETEQTQRAHALSRLPGIEVISTAALGPDTLRDALNRVQGAARRNPAQFPLNGAKQTVDITRRLRDNKTC